MSEVVDHLSQYSEKFKTFIMKNGLVFFINMHNVEKTPVDLRCDFHRLSQYLYDAGSNLMSLNSKIQISLQEAIQNKFPQEIIIEIVSQLSQIENDWNQAIREGWISEPFQYLQF